MEHQNISISKLSPEQIWNQIEYETKKNPIEKLFPMNYAAGRWEKWPRLFEQLTPEF